MSSAQIKAADVKALRDKTGVGMMDCKNALEKAGGDFAKAETILKELGLAAAQKRSGRATHEGKIFSRVEGSRAVLLELLCETDFVARNSEFQALGNELSTLVMAKGPTQVTPEMQEMVNTAIGKIKENIGIGRFETVKAGPDEMLATYVHGDKIGVAVTLRLSPASLRDDARVKEAATDCALHVAAFAPLYLRQSDVEPAYIKEQEAIFLVQAKSTGKPENVIQGIVKGKLRKHLQEICLLDQLHVKQTKKSMADVLKELSSQVGGNVEISGYRYYRLGSD